MYYFNLYDDFLVVHSTNDGAKIGADRSNDDCIAISVPIKSLSLITALFPNHEIVVSIVTTKHRSN